MEDKIFQGGSNISEILGSDFCVTGQAACTRDCHSIDSIRAHSAPGLETTMLTPINTIRVILSPYIENSVYWNLREGAHGAQLWRQCSVHIATTSSSKQNLIQNHLYSYKLMCNCKITLHLIHRS